MSKNVSTSFNQKTIFNTTFLATFSSEEKVEMFLKQHPSVWETYSEFPSGLKKELIDFCIGKQGLKITYDPVFRKIFNPTLHPDRLESFLSSILGYTVRIVKIIPREGTQLNEQTSFVIMDVLVRRNFILIKINISTDALLHLTQIFIKSLPAFMKISLSALTVSVLSYII